MSTSKYPVLLATMALLLSACNSSREASDREAGVPASAAATLLPSAPPLDTPLATGPLVVENQVDVASQRDGLVASILVDVGARVQKGQLLAVLDDRQLVAERDATQAKTRSIEADVKNWEAQAQVDEADLARAEGMMAANLITQQQLDHARYRVTQSHFEIERERQNFAYWRATLRALELELEKTRIQAPFQGIVARRYVRVGQRVAAGDRVFWVTATEPLRVKFTLPQKYLGQVHAGDRLAVSSAETSPEHPQPAKVIHISPVVDPSSGTIEVTAEIVGTPGNLRPGMTTNIRLAPQQ